MKDSWQRHAGCDRSMSCVGTRCTRIVCVFSIGFLLLMLYGEGVPRQSITEKHYASENKDREHIHATTFIETQQFGNPKNSVFAEKNIERIHHELNGVSENRIRVYVTNRDETMNESKEKIQKIYSKKKNHSNDTVAVSHPNATTNTTTIAPTKSNTTTVTTNTTHTAAATITAPTAAAAVFAHPATTTSPAFLQQNHDDKARKMILFYTKFFSGSWESFLGNKALWTHNCPVTNCNFIFNTSHPEDADAVIFHSRDNNMKAIPKLRRPDQLYIWLNMEAPQSDGGNGILHQLARQSKRLKNIQHQADENLYGSPGFFNWTYTYHRDSDLLLLYGGLWPLKGKGNGVQPGLLDASGTTYRDYVAALHRGDLLQDDGQQDWSAFLARPKLVAWMISHCSSSSGREFYGWELRQHLQVDVFGKCGELKCGQSHHDLKCYSTVLRPNYKFYLAFENNLCEDYITEKVWLPLHYGLVPVVYGGARYAHFLPPHSYVDATYLTPLQLARLLSSVGSSPKLYGLYHLWRKYWKVLLTPPLCELCLKLHLKTSNNKEALQGQTYGDLQAWWWRVNNCTTHYPPDYYPRLSELEATALLQRMTNVKDGILKKDWKASK